MAWSDRLERGRRGSGCRIGCGHWGGFGVLFGKQVLQDSKKPDRRAL
jgi:hypothetical protein